MQRSPEYRFEQTFREGERAIAIVQKVRVGLIIGLPIVLLVASAFFRPLQLWLTNPTAAASTPGDEFDARGVATGIEPFNLLAFIIAIACITALVDSYFDRKPQRLARWKLIGAGVLIALAVALFRPAVSWILPNLRAIGQCILGAIIIPSFVLFLRWLGRLIFSDPAHSAQPATNYETSSGRVPPLVGKQVRP